MLIFQLPKFEQRAEHLPAALEVLFGPFLYDHKARHTARDKHVGAASLGDTKANAIGCQLHEVVIIRIDLVSVGELLGLYVGHNAIASRSMQIALATEAMAVAKGPLGNPRLLAKGSVELGHSAFDVLLMASDHLALIEALY